MPFPVAAALATVAPVPSRNPLSAEQVAWLRQLASGATVAQLAERAGYSERAMYRLLQALYRELGVRSRNQAIMQAQQKGWLRIDTADPASG